MESAIVPPLKDSILMIPKKMLGYQSLVNTDTRVATHTMQ